MDDVWFKRAANRAAVWLAANICGVSKFMGDPVAALNRPAYKFVASGGNADVPIDDGDNGAFWFISSCFILAKMFACRAAKPERVKRKSRKINN